MSGLGWASAGLAVLGAVTSSAGPLLVGLVGLLVEGTKAVWARFGLRGLEYERHLATDRVVCGDVLALDVTVRNRKVLPLPWLRATDLASDELALRERPLVPAGPAGEPALVNAWSLGAFERVVRHFHILAERRGTYALGPLRLAVGDPFARRAATADRADSLAFLVRPRMVPVRAAQPARAWVGQRPARRGPLEHSLLFAGIRPYQPGDPVRSVHWRATARAGRPLVKRYDPALHQEVLIALDIATPAGDRSVGAFDDELVEGLCVAAASLARALLADDVACGLAVAAFSGSPRRFVYLAPGSAPAQLGRIGDLLARLSPVPSARFEDLLAGLPARLRPGATVLVLSSRPLERRLGVERRLAASGFPIRHLAFGPGRDEAVAAARRARVPAMVASLDPDWRTSDALRLVG